MDINDAIYYNPVRASGLRKIMNEEIDNISNKEIEVYSIKQIFEAKLSTKSPRTIRAYLESIEHYAGSCGHISVESAMADMIRSGLVGATMRAAKYTKQMQDTGLAPSTIRIRLSAIKFYLSCARGADLIQWQFDPAMPAQENKKHVEGPNHKEFKKILKVIRKSKSNVGIRNRAIVYMLSFMAMRISEILSLDIEHIDFKKSRASILRKGKRVRAWRTIPVKTIKLLKKMIRSRAEEKGPLFVNFDRKNPGGRLRYSSAYRIIRNIGKKAGCKSLHPHAFRHFSATEALDISDGNARKAKKHTGHSSDKMLDVYEDARKDEAGEMSNQIEARWMVKGDPRPSADIVEDMISEIESINAERICKEFENSGDNIHALSNMINETIGGAVATYRMMKDRMKNG